MEKVVLERIETSDEGTFGRITIGKQTFYSGELPWRGNASNRSCVPLGIYPCVQTLSPRFHRFLYLLQHTDSRSNVRIHPANFMGDRELRDPATGKLKYHSELNGCIALGMHFGEMLGQKAVISATTAIRLFHESLDNKPFVLEIVQR
jgi:hypothetical protein